MIDLYSVIGTKTYENLLADPAGADLITVDIEPGSGEIPAGALLYRKANGFYAPASTSEISTSYNLVVNRDPVDVGTDVEAGAVATPAAAYRAGCFVDGAVTVTSNGVITAAHKVVLRMMGIVFDKKESTTAFDNGSYTVTYMPNNGEGSTDEPVVDIKLAGVAYTILNNTDSKLGFTAPASKSFDGWDTKADGSGTGYDAADSYTTDANLVLYAVWVV